MLIAGDRNGRILRILTENHTIAPKGVMGRFLRAMLLWARAGFPILTGSAYAIRHDTCQTCTKWRPDGFFGLGKCANCGCSGLKLRLPTETCAKWRPLRQPR
jgi:hypothetical protein